MTEPTGLEPTQTRRPARATIRTVLQVGIPAMLLLPTVFAILIEELGPNLPPSITGWLVVAGGLITAVAAALARIMAIPAVELLFRRLPGAAFAAQPYPKPAPTENGEHGRLNVSPLAVVALIALVFVLLIVFGARS